MAEEQNKATNKETNTEENTGGLEIGSKDDLVKFLTDLQGQMNNLQETVDKVAPAKEEESEEQPPGSEKEEQEPSEEQVNEIDAMLQED